jgi:phosphomannomutase
MTTAHLPPEIFKAYDIRGVVGRTLTPEIVRSVGRALGSLAQDRNRNTLVIGRDGRLSGPELAAALADGIRAAGRECHRCRNDHHADVVLRRASSRYAMQRYGHRQP